MLVGKMDVSQRFFSLKCFIHQYVMAVAYNYSSHTWNLFCSRTSYLVGLPRKKIFILAVAWYSTMLYLLLSRWRDG